MATLVRLLLVLLSYVAITAHSAELGVVGPTYEITEPDLIEVIQSRLKRMEKSGELGRKQNEYRDRVIGGIEKPNAVSGINAAATTAHASAAAVSWPSPPMLNSPARSGTATARPVNTKVVA